MNKGFIRPEEPGSEYDKPYYERKLCSDLLVSHKDGLDCSQTHETTRLSIP